MKKYCAYYRVSTAEQGKSGLGLEAQRKAVLEYINSGAEVIKEFKEIESGTKERPELKKAIQFCKANKATLVVSKMDRLARSVWLFEKFKREGIEFEIVGLPKNPLVQQILSSVAEFEARAISERTKSALQIKKLKGVLLGSNNPKTREGLKKLWKKKSIERAKKEKELRREKAKKIAMRSKGEVVSKVIKRKLADQAVVPQIKLLRQQGYSYKKIANALNKSNVPTRQGGKWSDIQVIRVAKRNKL